jgi:hypothetical protein
VVTVELAPALDVKVKVELAEELTGKPETEDETEKLDDEKLEMEVLEDEIIGGRQVPSPLGSPLSHLQLSEHPSPSTVFPSSHSSPRDGSQWPSPHFAGVAPRLRIYGRPIVPSPKT